VLGPEAQGGIPAGTVFIGLASKSTTKTIKYISNEKTRIAIKQDIARFAIKVLCEFIESARV